MSLLEKSDEEIIKIADPMWDNLVKCSNIKDYGDLQEISHHKCFMELTK